MLCEELKNLIKEKFGKLNEIQEKAIPLILNEKNVIVSAPTGSGKTECALIPIFNKLLKEKISIFSLYVTPLRALNRDLLSRIEWWANKLDLEVSVRHSDTSLYERRKQSIFAPNILITTPETLNIILVGKRIREFLKNVKYVIIDEIQEFLDSKRGSQLACLIKRLKLLSKQKIVFIVLSATISDLKEIEKIFDEKFEVVSTIQNKKYKIDVLLEEDLKKRIEKIVEKIKKYKSTLIFTNTREQAELLANRIKSFDKNLKIEVHHSSLSKEVREKVEEELREGKLNACIATSSLQLGIDIGHIDFVIQYNSPRQVSQLIQRIGRGKHKISEISEGLIICENFEDYLEAKNILEKMKENYLEKQKVFENCLDVLALQIIGLLLEYGKMDINEIFKIVKEIQIYKNLSQKEFFELIKFLKNHKFIFLDGNIARASKKGLKLYFENTSLIPDTKQLKIINVEENKVIGMLDESFVRTELEIGSSILVKGEIWDVLNIDEEKVEVALSNKKEAIIPYWEGELLPVEYEVAKLMQIPKEIEVFPYDNKFCYIIYSPFGNKVNLAIQIALYALIGSKIEKLFIKSDAYRIFIFLPFRNDEIIIESLKNLNKENIEEIIKIAIKSTKIFEYKFLHVAKRFGIIKKDSKISKSLLKILIENYKNDVVGKETINEIFQEKLDIENAKKVIEELKNYKIVFNLKPSKFAEIGLRKLFFIREEPTYLKPVAIEKVKERILNRRIVIACLNCGWYDEYIVKTLPEEIICKKCNSKLITLIKTFKDLKIKIIKKKLENKKLSKKEQKEYEKMFRIAELIMENGKDAIIALSGIGIGIKSAIEILREKEKMFEKIYEKEKEFVKKKRFLAAK